MKGWLAVLSALLFILPPGARAADDQGGAARELARKAAAFAGRGESIAIAWRNLSGLSSSDSTQARTAFEAAIRESGGRPAETGTVEVRVTLSENQSQYLLVAEGRKGEERQTWIASWKRAAAAAVLPAGVVLEKKLVWEQGEPILDVAVTPSGILVLSGARLTMYTQRDGAMELRQSAAVNPARPLPRDPRGRLRVTGAVIKVFLPGTLCSGSVEPTLALQCRASEEPWTLESGSRTVMLAGFAAGRNYFDGHVVTQSGVRKTVPAFYTAGALEEQGRQYWVLALVDGRTQILDANFDPAGAMEPWGSDLAATDARCGGGSQIVSTKGGDSREADSVRAYAMVNRTPTPLTPPVELPGPVTALWTSNGTSVVAVVRDFSTGHFAAYLLTVVCGA